MSRLQLALDLRQADARPSELAGMARFGNHLDGRLGLLMSVMCLFIKHPLESQRTRHFDELFR